MPNYATRCTTCRETRDVRLSFAEYDEVKAETKTIECPSCGGTAAIEFAPGILGFVMKDGESGGWASKANKENHYRARRSTVMAQRERDNVFKPKLVPNFKGLETETWRNAQEVARQEKGDESAITYEPLVSQEQTT